METVPMTDGVAVARAMAPYAAFLALLYVWLTIRVVGARRAARVALGTGGDPALTRAMRVHGNFIEYVPFGLLLIALAGVTTGVLWLVHGLAATLVLGRVIHAWGVSRSDEVFRHRVIGMMLTFATLVIAALALLATSILNI